jgi:hypothetical protein
MTGGWRSGSSNSGGLAGRWRLVRCPFRRSGSRGSAGGCRPEGCRFEFGLGRHYARLRNSAGRVANRDPGGGGCRGLAIGATRGVICECIVVRSRALFGRGVNQRIRLRPPRRRLRPEFLYLPVLWGEVVNDPVRLGPRLDERFANSTSGVITAASASEFSRAVSRLLPTAC